jgi:hypothetical protein
LAGKSQHFEQLVHLDDSRLTRISGEHLEDKVIATAANFPPLGTVLGEEYLNHRIVSLGWHTVQGFESFQNLFLPAAMGVPPMASRS